MNLSMPFSNRDYLYGHLPARFRRADRDQALFLKRFLHWFGEQLDGFDELYETFHQKINPQNAPEEFVDFWLWALLGWSWFPKWFTLERKRQLYADFATNLARRGTALGIEEFLRAFSIYARVYSRPQYWGEFVWGEGGWTVTGPLGLVVQIDHLADEVNHDFSGQGWGEFAWGEGYFAETLPALTRREIEDLLRFQWPVSQTVMIDYRTRPNVAGPGAWDEEDALIFNDEMVPNEESGPVDDLIGD